MKLIMLGLLLAGLGFVVFVPIMPSGSSYMPWEMYSNQKEVIADVGGVEFMRYGVWVGITPQNIDYWSQSHMNTIIMGAGCGLSTLNFDPDRFETAGLPNVLVHVSGIQDVRPGRYVTAGMLGLPSAQGVIEPSENIYFDKRAFSIDVYTFQIQFRVIGDYEVLNERGFPIFPTPWFIPMNAKMRTETVYSKGGSYIGTPLDFNLYARFRIQPWADYRATDGKWNESGAWVLNAQVVKKELYIDRLGVGTSSTRTDTGKEVTGLLPSSEDNEPIKAILKDYFRYANIYPPRFTDCTPLANANMFVYTPHTEDADMSGKQTVGDLGWQPAMPGPLVTTRTQVYIQAGSAENALPGCAWDGTTDMSNFGVLCVQGIYTVEVEVLRTADFHLFVGEKAGQLDPLFQWFCNKIWRPLLPLGDWWNNQPFIFQVLFILVILAILALVTMPIIMAVLNMVGASHSARILKAQNAQMQSMMRTQMRYSRPYQPKRRAPPKKRHWWS